MWHPNTFDWQLTTLQMVNGALALLTCLRALAGLSPPRGSAAAERLKRERQTGMAGFVARVLASL
jgi:hypothetical protein